MADNSKNILSRLQQMSVQPPADAFDKAWNTVVPPKEKTADQNPTSENMEQKIFTNLQDYSIPSPPLDFIGLKNKALQIAPPANNSVKISPYLLRAASIFLLLAAAATLYFIVFNKKDNNIVEYAAENKNNNATTGVADSKSNDTLSASVISNTRIIEDSKVSLSINENSKKVFASKGIIKKGGSKVTFTNGGEAKLYENDVLLTLTSYSSNDWRQFFTNAVEDKKITLNKYSYLNLSDKMVEMLQDTYLMKKNGSPSRKAKKTKKKFDKWRKKDEKYFDKNMQKNPTDIIDLSDFTL